MNNDQSKHFRMYRTVQEYLNAQTPTWNVIPKIVSIKNDMDTLITNISEKSDEAANVVRVTAKKEDLKLTLGIKIAGLSGILQAYANEIEDKDLANSVKATKSDISRMNETEISPFVRKLVTIAQGKLTDLADYGITEDNLTEILTTLDDFEVLIGKPRVIQNQKYMALSDIAQLFNEMDELVKKRLDNIMLIFRETNTAFYDGYLRSRSIVD